MTMSASEEMGSAVEALERFADRLRRASEQLQGDQTEAQAELLRARIKTRYAPAAKVERSNEEFLARLRAAGQPDDAA
jgi:ppGpp synthetase/RelA/SpoT-type nucleotidyltranferase